MPQSSQTSQSSQSSSDFVTVRIHRNLFTTVRNLVLCALKLSRDICKTLENHNIPFIKIDDVFQVLTNEEGQDRLLSEALLASFGEHSLQPKETLKNPEVPTDGLLTPQCSCKSNLQE